MPAVEARQQIGDRVQAIDAHSLEVGAQDGFNRPLPAPLHPQLLRDARPQVERLSLQPLRDFAGYLAQRGLLQRFGGHLEPESLLPARTQRVEA